MRKVYIKPQIMFEDFTLSTNIAGTCEVITDTPSGGKCGYAYEGGGGSTLFTATLPTSVCFIQVDDDITNGFCYQVPVDDKTLFNS